MAGPALRRARPERPLRQKQRHPGEHRAGAGRQTTAGCASGTTTATRPWSCSASPANLTNLFSNDEDESNGLVKAWAQIDADGTIVACWRCNTDPAETRRLGTGAYEVDFTPLRPTSAGGRGRRPSTTRWPLPGCVISLADRTTDPSSVHVDTADPNGNLSDATLRPDHLLIARSCQWDRGQTLACFSGASGRSAAARCSAHQRSLTPGPLPPGRSR